MNQISRMAAILIAVVLIVAGVMPAFAQDNTVCTRTIEGATTEFSVGDTYTTESGLTQVCTESGNWRNVQAATLASFELSDGVTEITFTRDTRKFVNQPVDMLPFTFPLTGEVVDGVLSFEIEGVMYTIEIADQLTQIEATVTAESAATPTGLPGLPGQDDGTSCTNVLFTYPANSAHVVYDFEAQSGVTQANDWYVYGSKTIIVIEKAIMPLETSAYAPGLGSAFGYYLDRPGCESYSPLEDMTRYAGSRLDQGASGVIVDASTGVPVFYRVTLVNNEPVRSQISLASDTEANQLWAMYLAARTGGTPIGVAGASAQAVTTCSVSGPATTFNVRSGRGLGYSVVEIEPALTTLVVHPAVDGWHEVVSPVHGYVSADIVIGNCGETATVTVQPLSVQTTGATCQPATRVENADGRGVTGPAVIEAWDGPATGNILVLANMTVSGYKGAVWAYNSQACAEADLTSAGKTWTIAQ